MKSGLGHQNQQIGNRRGGLKKSTRVSEMRNFFISKD